MQSSQGDYVVSLSELLTSLDYQYTWNKETLELTVITDNMEVVLTSEDDVYKVNGENKKRLEHRVFKYRDNLYISLSDIYNIFDLKPEPIFS